MEKQPLPLFYRVAIIFSFIVSLVLVLVLVASLFLLPALLRPTLTQVMAELDNLENAVITTTVNVDQAMPVRGAAIQVLKPITVTTTGLTEIQGAWVVMAINENSSVAGSTYIALPQGVNLPIDFRNNIIMSTTIPVRLSIPVSIPLKDTQVGAFAANLKAMLAPLTNLLGIK